MPVAKIFFWGMLISFLGTLPLSPLNVSAMEISTRESIHQGMYFSLGTIFTEIIYARITVAGVNRIRKHNNIFTWAEWITLALIIALAAGSFHAANSKTETNNILLNNDINRFVLGMMMSALTFMHIPFWFGWSTVLFSKKILKEGNTFYNVYVAAIGTGTFLANCIFIYGGILIVNKLNNNQHMINIILGWIFVITAIIQFIKIIWFKPKEEIIQA